MTAALDPQRSYYPVAQTMVLARRAILSVARQPSVWFPSVLFPLLIAAVNSSAMSRAVNLPGFPDVESFWQFLLPATLVQGVLFGGIIAGSDVALDIQDGFFDRLVASPVARTSILLGRLSGASVLGAVQAVIFVTIFWAVGAPVRGGPLAVLTLIAMGMILAVAVGALAAAIGLRTGSQEAVQNSFPLVFVLIFLSSAFFPTDLMSGWYQTVARANPLSWMIDAARSLVISGFSPTDAAQALGIAATLAVVAMVLALSQLRRRLAVAA
ncbi:MAG: ABC transporter permease [Acidimicrobiia bacterium]|nr:ABC transporter permease [Acidimicrobiia bacterium]